VIRSAAEPLMLVDGIRAVVAEIDPHAPLFAVRTMADVIGTSDGVFRRRTVTQLVAVFSAASVSLALIGLFGLVSQAVGRRTAEFGVRVTLGAGRRTILASALRHGLAPAAVGIVAGAAVTLASTGAMARLLFGVAPRDAATLAGTAAGFAAAAAIACLIPARRALAVDPADALRQQRG
jgi:ABC-type antimicrobial peptide transport system permease subunit